MITTLTLAWGVLKVPQLAGLPSGPIEKTPGTMNSSIECIRGKRSEAFRCFLGPVVLVTSNNIIANSYLHAATRHHDDRVWCFGLGNRR